MTLHVPAPYSFPPLLTGILVGLGILLLLIGIWLGQGDRRKGDYVEEGALPITALVSALLFCLPFAPTLRHEMGGGDAALVEERVEQEFGPATIVGGEVHLEGCVMPFDFDPALRVITLDTSGC